MNRVRVWAVARKEFLHIVRDPRSLGMAIAIPLLMILLFGSSLSLDVDHVPMVVWDQSDSPASRDYISGFAASPYFALQGYVTSYGQIEQVIDKRQALLALVVPRDFAQRLDGGRATAAQLLVDGSDANTATLAIAYAEAITDNFNGQLLTASLRQRGVTAAAVPVTPAPRVWFNQEMAAKNYLVPGLIAVIMMVIAALLTSLTVAREWENGTMEMLITTPVQPRELILGKLIPYFTIGMVDVLLAVLAGQFIFQVPLRGSAALVFLAAAVFLVGALTMGMLISIAARTQLLASQLAMVTTFLPAFLLSGFMYAIANMPLALQGLTYLIPARYLVTALKSIYLKGAGLALISREIALLAVFAVVLIMVASAKFRKRLV